MLTIQKELFAFAQEGLLLVAEKDFISKMEEKFGTRTTLVNLAGEDTRALIAKAEEQGVIHQTRRNFAKIKTLTYVSLKLDVVSFQVLRWVLVSLYKDEMTPTEKAIQSRIKEAFAYKITKSLWEAIINNIEGRRSPVPPTKYKPPRNVPMHVPAYYPYEKREQTVPQFFVKEVIEDPTVG